MTAPSGPGEREERFLKAFRILVERNQRTERSMTRAMKFNVAVCALNVIVLVVYLAAQWAR